MACKEEVIDFTFKRGDGAIITCDADQTISSFTITCEIRTKSGTLVDTMDVEILSATQFKMTPIAGTSTWPLGVLYSDILFVSGAGVPVHTEDFIIEILQERTKG